MKPQLINLHKVFSQRAKNSRNQKARSDGPKPNFLILLLYEKSSE